MNSDVGPVVVMPGWIISNPDIPHPAFRLYAVISLRLAMHGTEGTPSRETLAADLGASLDTVDRYTRILVKAGALALTKSAGKINKITVCLCHPQPSHLAHTYPESVTPNATHAGGGLRLNIPQDKPWILKDKPNSSRKPHQEPLYIRESIGVVSSSTVRTARPMPRFHAAWDRYPNHQQRPRAQQRWLKMGVEDDSDLWVAIRDGVDHWAKYWDASATQAQYIPLFCHWLDRQQYTDRPAIEPPLSKQSRGLLLARKAFLEEPNK